MNAPPVFWTHEPKLDRSPVTIRTTRPMLLTRHGETAPRHADTGQTIEIERHLLAKLDPADFERLPTAPPPMQFDI